MTREKLYAKLEKLECRLHQEQSRLYQQINNIGWGAGMRRVRVTPSFAKEDAIKRQIEKVKEQLKNFE